MKIEQLSVNDWVAIDGVPSKVMSIDSVTGLLRVSGKGNPIGMGIVEPIPLTPEILEKNGFDAPKAKAWNDSWYWSNRKDVALELRESFGLWYMEIVTKEQRSGLQSNRKLGIGFKYVHQLQNALRLAGVEKEIEL